MNRFLAILSLFGSGFAFSQFGNEWIQYGQDYYYFKIAQNGVYRLDYATLASSGVPVSTIDPDNFQIFGFEKEQQIYVEDGGDGSFDAGDYMLFYAHKNTTWLDSMLYDSPSLVSNRYYPHYNDTICYYLTWNASTSNERMVVETDVDFAAYTAKPYFQRKQFFEYHTRYLEGEKVSLMSNATYVAGEGWMSDFLQAVPTNAYMDHNFSTTNAYSGAGAPLATGLAVSTGGSSAESDGSGNHHLRLQYGPTNIVLYDTIFSDYPQIKLPFSIPASFLGTSTTRIRHQTVNDLGVASDLQNVAFVEFTYPHTPDLEADNYYEMIVPYNSSASKTRYDFTNFSATVPLAFVIDGNLKKIPVVNTAGTYQVLIPNQAPGKSQTIVILDESQVMNVTDLDAVNGTGAFTDFSSVDFENAYLIVTHSSLLSTATDYANYRSSLTGGGHNTIIANADELYHQFGGGVPKHVMGVRRFAHYAWTAATQKPTSLFIIGKGVREANEILVTGNGTRQSSTSYNMCFVPTYGYPASDNLITARLEGNLWDPLIPTGRLAAQTELEVQTYLSKVMEYESAQNPTSAYTIEDKYWQKNILHFGGGANGIEQSWFKYYLENYEEILEGPQFGGNVTAFYKTVSDPIDPVTLYEVTDYINRGVSLMTFFGHASADGFDQNVDDPENWDNQGKYPVVVGNACLTGNIHEPNNLSTSEEYVMIPNRGAIAFLANVKQAFSTSLNEFSQSLFTDVSVNNYGSTIGEHIQNAINYVEDPGMSFALRNVCLQMTLHGDPGLRFNTHPEAELEVNQTSFFITPSVVDLSVDSIDVNVVIYNMGHSSTDTFAVELNRIFPNNNGDSLYTKLVNGIDYVDTVVFTIPFYNNIGIGMNEFEVRVDMPSIVPEVWDEVGNNQLTKQILFDVDGIYPVWPYDYAVVPNDTIVLKGSTVNPFAGPATYRFEIDTTDLFNSPRLKYCMKTVPGGVVEVEHDEWLRASNGMQDLLILEDSMVYFWRATVIDTGEYYWIERSFQYINGKSGWGQDHFFQYKNNDFLFLDYNRDARSRYFGPAFKTIDCDVYGNADTWLEFAFTLYHINGEIAEYNFCGLGPQIMVCVIDPFTLEPWGTLWDDGFTVANPTHNFGNQNNNGGCRPRVEWHFAFAQSSPTQMAACQNMIENEIPDSFYYLIYTTRFADYDLLNGYPSIYSTFQNLGSDSVYFGRTEDVPFILFGKKGNTDYFKESYGTYLDEVIHLEDTMWGYDFYGEESSTIIGPATKWNSIYWRQTPMESPTDDSTRLQLYGLSWSGSKTLLVDTLFTSLDSISNLDALIDAEDYPYLQLNCVLRDSGGFSPAQVDFWHVLYDHVPEAALDGSAGLHFLPGDTISEGQQIEVAFDITNVSDVPMDSLLISYWIEDVDHNLIPIVYPRQDSLRVGEKIRDTLSIPTVGLRELNSLWIEVNPYVTSFTTDQPEQYHFNNLAQIPFYANWDEENPILDVTFNGNHILNGDIVDPRSQIVISLKDDNPFLLMDEESDTANFGLYLTWPDGNQKELNFKNSLGEQLMQWYPASGSDKKFKIVYDADLTMNGTYRLLVQGADESGNNSGKFEYDIEFEVIHESSITNLMNYPNPFSTQTQFVFTLTGSVIPDEFTIQILTVTGKVVREITVDELGEINIGRNITEYRWDGKDEYGDQLANGVYLYHVITKIDGEDVEHRESGADEYFTKGFGKMYLMR